MIMKHFFNMFKRHPKKAKNSDPAMQMLLRSVAMTDEKELSCEDVYALMDQFAEMVKRGEDASQLMPMVQMHLAMCPDCQEEYETLMQMLKTPSKEAGSGAIR
jgi:hypothetical protein